MSNTATANTIMMTMVGRLKGAMWAYSLWFCTKGLGKLRKMSHSSNGAPIKAVMAPVDNSQPVCNSMFCKTESVSSSNNAPMKNAAMAWAGNVRKPMCLLAAAAAKPAKPNIPTMLTTLALKNAAMSKPPKRSGITGTPKLCACSSPKPSMDKGLANTAMATNASNALTAKPCTSCQPSCTKEPLLHCMMLRASSL